MIKKLLVPIDGSRNSDRAIRFAAQFSIKFDAPVLLLHVLGEVPARKQLKRYLKNLEAEDIREAAEIESIKSAISKSGEEKGAKLLKQAVQIFKDAGGKRADTALEDGDSASVILRYADKKKFDMIIMGRRGRGKIKSILLGSLSHKIISLASCPVAIVK